MAKPVIIGDCTLYHGDCMEILPGLPRVDAVVTDPPYGINYKPGGGGKVKKNFTNDDRIVGDDKPFDPSFLVGKASVNIFWGGSNFADKLPASRGWLVWDKKVGVNLTNQFSDCEIAWTDINGPIRIFSHRWTGYMKDSEKDDNRVHPTQKPLAVMEWCLGFIPNATTILDPFMGSGTTGVACIRLGRKFIGIEKEAKYFDIACKRIEQEYQRTALFDEVPKAEQAELFAEVNNG